jgi:hypothetical protein
MAGTGVRLFLSGDTAYAADINTYLMDQVVARFATTAARDAAFGDGIPVSQGGSGKPALSEGRICYIDELNLIQYYNGASWQDSAQFTVGDGAITTQKLAANSVTSDKIAPGTVIAADIAAGTITATELADGAVTAGKILDGTITATELADGAVTSGKILDGTIVNADVNASAAIALSKLATGTSGHVVVHNSSGVPTSTAISGDITIDSTGNVQIAADKIVNADINASAAIAYSKLNLANSIITTDLASGAPRAGFRSSQNQQTGTTYTMALSDLGGLVELSNTSSITETIPLESSVAFAIGDRIDLLQTNTGQVTVVGAAGVTLNAYDNQYKLNGRWAAGTIIKRAANTWVLIGNITS